MSGIWQKNKIMILIKIPIKTNTKQLEAIVSALRYRLLSQPEIMVNGKSVDNDREKTFHYQLTLKLAEKLSRKLMDKKLNPGKKKEFTIKLNYPEAYTLYNVLFEVETPPEIALYNRSIFSQLDKML